MSFEYIMVFTAGSNTGTLLGGAADTVIVLDVALVNEPDVNVNVRSPAVPLIDRFVNVATPLEFVVTVVVPPSVPRPVAIAAMTDTPDCENAVFDASRS